MSGIFGMLSPQYDVTLVPQSYPLASNLDTFHFWFLADYLWVGRAVPWWREDVKWAPFLLLGTSWKTIQLITVEYYVCCDWSHVAYIMLNRGFPSIPSLGRVFMMNGCWMHYGMLFLVMELSCGFCLFLCWRSVTCIFCWSILVNLRWIQLDYGVWVSFVFFFD